MKPFSDSPIETGVVAHSSYWRQDGPRFVLATWLLATFAVIASGAVVLIALSIVWTVRAALAGERSEARLAEVAQDAIESQVAGWALVISSQLTLLLFVWIACRVVGKSLRERVGLLPTGLSVREGMTLLVSTAVPLGMGLGAATLISTALGVSADDDLGLQRMWSEGGRAASVAWILLIALLPGLIEEVFYRGFLQRGLLLRWGPAAAIGTSSLLFAVVHGELTSAVAVFPLGLWLGVIAWRTGSIRMTIVMHAMANGTWTTLMMVLARHAASEPLVNGIVIATSLLGLIAFPFAVRVLRKPTWATTCSVPPSSGEPKPTGRQRESHAFVVLVAAGVVTAASVLFCLIPASNEPATEHVATLPATPSIGTLESSVVETVSCMGFGDEGAIEFDLIPANGTWVLLPPNRIGVEQVIVALDGGGHTVWLAYGGEVTGKGVRGRPAGVVEQLASGDPTVISMTLTQGRPPVKVRLMLEEQEHRKLAAFARARAEGWAIRGRK